MVKATESKADRLNSLISKIDTNFGKGSIMRLGDKSNMEIERFSTGALNLDIALGGGLPKGRIVELWGGESMGKSTLTLHAIAEVQKAGGICAIIDTEHALDPVYAAALGVDIEQVLISQPTTAEEGLEVVDQLISSGIISLVVVDSVAALAPRAEIEGEMGDSVSGDTPIFIKKNGLIDIVPIEDLWGGGKIPEGRTTARYTKFKGKEKEGIQVLTDYGWSDINAVFLKQNYKNKPISVISTANGLCKTTEDHSLFINGREASPRELSVGNVLDTYTDQIGFNDRSPVDLEVAWLLGYFAAEGSLAGRGIKLSDTTEELVDKASKIGYYKLCCLPSHSTKVYEPPNPRVPLYTVRLSTRDEVYALFSKCVSKNGYKKVPDVVLNASLEIQKAFLEGFKDGDGSIALDEYKLSTSSFCLAAGLEYMLSNLGMCPYVSSQYREGRQVEMMVCTGKTLNRRYRDGEIKKMFNIEAPEFLYDISTDAGTFVGGVGKIIHHNSHMGLQARLMGQALRKITAKAHETGTTVFFTNQIRQKIGVTYGSNEALPGGNALKFYASIRMKISRIQTLKKGADEYGIRSKVRVMKNKTAVPFKEAEFDILFGKGISTLGCLVDLAEERGIIVRKGAWYSYEGDNVGQGRENTIEWLKLNPEIATHIEAQIKSAASIKVDAPVVVEEE
jgi:RecA/RadA recombinase